MCRHDWRPVRQPQSSWCIGPQTDTPGGSSDIYWHVVAVVLSCRCSLTCCWRCVSTWLKTGSSTAVVMVYQQVVIPPMCRLCAALGVSSGASWKASAWKLVRFDSFASSRSTCQNQNQFWVSGETIVDRVFTVSVVKLWKFGMWIAIAMWQCCIANCYTSLLFCGLQGYSAPWFICWF